MTLAKRDSAVQVSIQKAIKALVKRKGELCYPDIPALRADIDVRGVTANQVADGLRALRGRDIRLRTYRGDHELAGWTRIWPVPDKRNRKHIAA
jgi:hypothetical protein